MRVTVTNKTATAQEFELVSLVRNAGDGGGRRRSASRGTRSTAAAYVPGAGSSLSPLEDPLCPGPLGGSRQLRHPLKVAAGASARFDLQFLGDGLSPDAAHAAAAQLWQGEARSRDASPASQSQAAIRLRRLAPPDAHAHRVAAGSRPSPQRPATLLRSESLRHIPGQPRPRRGRSQGRRGRIAPPPDRST